MVERVVAMRPTAPELSPSVSLLLSTAPIALAIVISRPSSTQAIPSASTILVWNGAQESRSMRAGIRLRTEGSEAWEIATGLPP